MVIVLGCNSPDIDGICVCIACIAAHPAILALIFTSKVAWKQQGLHTSFFNHLFGLLGILVLI